MSDQRRRQGRQHKRGGPSYLDGRGSAKAKQAAGRRRAGVTADRSQQHSQPVPRRLKPVESNTRPLFVRYVVAVTFERRIVVLNADGNEEGVRFETLIPRLPVVAKNGDFVFDGFDDADTATETLRVFSPNGSEVTIESQVEEKGVRVVKVRPVSPVHGPRPGGADGPQLPAPRFCG